VPQEVWERDGPSSLEARKAYTNWYNVAVYGGLQKFVAMMEKGALVAVSGPIYTQSFAGKNGKVEFYAVRANTLEMLKRKNTSTSDAQDEAAAEMVDGASW
jgi:single-stranded DNA-binding protein